MPEPSSHNHLHQKKLSILQEISSAIVLTDNVNAIANLMLDLAISHTRAEKGSIMLLSGDELYIMASRGLAADLAKNYRIRIGEGIAGKVAEDQQPVLVQNIDHDPRFSHAQRDRYKTRSFISCPIASKSNLLGVININDRKDGTPFSDDDFTLIKIIANQAAIALKNAFLVNQLKTKAHELEELNRKLIDSDLSKTEFLTRISHELRTPLNSIKGAIYYLQQAERLPAAEQKEFFSILSGETGKMVSIVEGQLDFLRLENEATFVKKSIISLNEIVQETISSRMLRDSLARRQIAIVTHLPTTLPHVAGDKVLVAQLFINLIEGLAFHLKENATIEISALDNGFVELDLKASAPFPEWILGQIFDAKTFFQAEQSDGVLKLYLARKTADSHGWNMTAHNSEHGFNVHLEIPKGTQQKAEAALSTAMDLYLEFVSEMLDLSTCSIMLTDEFSGDLIIKSAKGIDEDIVKRTRIPVGERIAGWVAQEGRPLLVEDIESDPRFPHRVGNGYYNSKSLLSLPLKVGEQVIGVINLNNKKSAKTFDQRDLTLISVISDRISYLINKLQAEEQKESDLKQLAATFENLLNAGRRYQKKNPRILDLMEKICGGLNLDETQRNEGLYVATVYDLGLMLIDEGVLNKKKKLTSVETSTLQVHPYATVGLLDKIEFSSTVRQAILHHHERWDGKGYPDGLRGEEIPILARALAVLDAYVSMTEDRPYRKALSHEETVAQMRRESGEKFDPAVVEALVAAFSR